MVLFAFIAGILSILSPCVLPLVPIVLGTALSQHRYGPLALALGVALSFTAIGMFVQTIGYALGIDTAVFQTAAAVLILVIGVVLLVPALQMRLALVGSPVGSFAQERFGGFDSSGLIGQFGVGCLLGAIWAPCTGPTLGAAVLLAAQEKELWLVTSVMLAYGLGAGIPMLLLGLLSRETLMRWKGGLLTAGRATKQVMGAGLVIVAVVMLSGYDRIVEAKLVAASPIWLTQLTTRF